MTELSNEMKMSLKEISEVLQKDESTIRKIGKELFPDSFNNGYKTYLNEYQITVIKSYLGKNSELPKTNIDKKLIVLEAINILNEEVEYLRSQNEIQSKRISLLIHDNKTYTASEIAKELNMKSGTELNKKLNEKDIQYKVNNTWVFYAKYSNCGYESIKQQELDNGKIIYNRHFTGKGRDFILNIFKSEVK